MDRFKGYPRQPKLTMVPDLFFSDLLPEIDDLTEERQGRERILGAKDLLGLGEELVWLIVQDPVAQVTQRRQTSGRFQRSGHLVGRFEG